RQRIVSAPPRTARAGREARGAWIGRRRAQGRDTRTNMEAKARANPAERQCRIQLATAADATEWNDFVASHRDGTIYHCYRWASLIREIFGHQSHYWCARDADGRIQGVLPLVRLRSRLFGDYQVSMPYFNYGGVLADSD